MKSMLNMGLWVLMFILTACPKKEDVVEPKKSELLGNWKWAAYGCGNGYPAIVDGNYKVIFDDNSITYLKNDTLLFKTSFTVGVSGNIKKISIDFKELNALKKRNDYHLFMDGEYTVSDSMLRMYNSDCFTVLVKI